MEETGTTRIIKGLKIGGLVKITTKDGAYEGIIREITDTLLVVSLSRALTSAKSHSYHWKAGEFKSELFKRIEKIKNLI